MKVKSLLPTVCVHQCTISVTSSFALSTSVGVKCSESSQSRNRTRLYWKQNIPDWTTKAATLWFINSTQQTSTATWICLQKKLLRIYLSTISWLNYEIKNKRANRPNKEGREWGRVVGGVVEWGYLFYFQPTTGMRSWDLASSLARKTGWNNTKKINLVQRARIWNWPLYGVHYLYIKNNISNTKISPNIWTA